MKITGQNVVLILVLAMAVNLVALPLSLAAKNRHQEWVQAPAANRNLLNEYLQEDLGVQDVSQFNLTLKYKDMAIDMDKFFSPVSEKALGEIYEAFSKRTYNNAWVLGAPGIGKSFLIEQLVALFSYGATTDTLKAELGLDNPYMQTVNKEFIKNMDVVLVNTELLSLNPTKDNQPFDKPETRMKLVLSGLFEAARKEFQHSGRRTMFVMDEVAQLPVVQEAMKKHLDKSGMKRPDDEFQRKLDVGFNVVAMTTPDEFRKMVDGDGAKERRGKIVKLNEPELDQALNILINEANELKHTFGGIEVEPDALMYIIHIRHLLNSPPVAMPASILAALQDLYPWFARTKAHKESRSTITLRDTQEFLMKRMGLTEQWLPGPNGEPPFHNLEQEVKKYVVGQDEAVAQIARVIKAWGRVGFGGEIPVIALAGPSASGKNTLIEGFSLALFGHRGKHLVFPLAMGREDDYAVDSLITGPPTGNHSDNKPPLILEKMEAGKGTGFLVFNEGKDAPNSSLVKFKEFVENGEIRPQGRDNRTRPLRFPVFFVGQWGEELFEGATNDQQINDVYAKITQAQIDEAMLHPKGPQGKGAVQRAFLQRIKKSGAVVLLKPVLKSLYPEVVKIQVREFKEDQRARNNLDIEVTDAMIDFISRYTQNHGEDTRGLGAAVRNFTVIALSEAGEHGVPHRDAKIKIDFNGREVVVSAVDGSGHPAKSWAANPLSLSVMKESCDADLGSI